MKQSQCCPVCQGRGVVCCGFYNISGMGSSSSTADETCKSCNGIGYILVEQNETEGIEK
jgi:DnaJ-class molecular chaperone